MPIRAMLLRAQPSGGGGGDPHWSSVIALLHFNGEDGSSSFPDQTGRAWNRVGDGKVSVAEWKFGGAAYQGDGSGDGLVTASATIADMALPGDFTVEAWVRTSVNNIRKAIYSHYSSNSNPGGLALEMSAAGKLSVLSQGISVAISSATTLPVNSWVHVAVSRIGSTLRLFINGEMDASASVNANFTPIQPALATIGYVLENGVAYHSWLGFIDELRVTKGVARYVANFTPPAAPFPDA